MRSGKTSQSQKIDILAGLTESALWETGYDDARAHEGAGSCYLAAPHTVLRSMFPPEIWSHSDQRTGCILTINPVDVSVHDMSLRLLAGLTESALWETGFDDARAHEGAGSSYQFAIFRLAIN